MGRMPEKVAETVTERANGYCEVMVSRRCTGGAEHLHHRKLRSQLGQHEVPNLVYVCHECHAWIHANPAKSYERGFLVRGARVPEHQPVLYRNGSMFFLARDGSLVKGGRS